jgi:hypothetical protein
LFPGGCGVPVQQRGVKVVFEQFGTVHFTTKYIHFLRTIILAAVITALGGACAHADKRVALVIGSSAYKNVAQLKNPVNDAAVVAMFKKAGFDTVDSKLDLSVVEMRPCLSAGLRSRLYGGWRPLHEDYLPRGL